MSNTDQAKSEYLRTKVLTASPEELHLMLYDGAIKFAEEAKRALAEGRLEEAHHATTRAQNILLEMSAGLNRELEPALCGKLASLYNFIYRRLVEGNMKHEVSALDDALKILNYQRETWVMLMAKIVAQSRPTESAEKDGGDEPAERPSLSVSV